MASEINATISLKIVSAGLTALAATSPVGDLSGSNFVGTVISATTSWVAIPLGSLASFRLLMLRNLDLVNYLQVATANDGTGIFATLQPSISLANANVDSVLYFPPTTSTLYIKAHTAACDCQLAATE